MPTARTRPISHRQIMTERGDLRVLLVSWGKMEPHDRIRDTGYPNVIIAQIANKCKSFFVIRIAVIAADSRICALVESDRAYLSSDPEWNSAEQSYVGCICHSDRGAKMYRWLTWWGICAII